MATYFIIMAETLLNNYWVSTVVEGTVRTRAQSTKNQGQCTSPFLTSPDNAKCSMMAPGWLYFLSQVKWLKIQLNVVLKKNAKD